MQSINIGLDKYLPSNFIPLNENFPEVIITSRNQDWGNIETLSLDVLTESEAESFIRNSLKLRERPGDKEIELLAYKLQRFPLALQQAVAFLNKLDVDATIIGEKSSIQKYLDIFNEKAKQVLDFKFPDHSADPYTKTTYITCEVTLDAIRSKPHGEAALKILNVMVYLNPDDIPSEIFSKLSIDTADRAAALNLLRKYSMITGGTGKSNIHRLVQKVIRIGLAEKGIEENKLREAINLVTGKEMCKQHVDHAVSIWEHASELEPNTELYREFAYRPSKISNLLMEDGRYKDAYKFGRLHIEPLRRAIGAGSLVTLVARGNVAGALSMQGKHRKALEIYNDIQKIHPYAENDRFSLEILNEKAKILNHQGQYDAAVVMFQVVYDERRKLLGPHEADTLGALNNIAVVYLAKREFKLAFDMFDEIYPLGVSKGITLSDENHRSALRNMAVCLNKGGEYDKAIRVYETIIQYQTIEDPSNSHPDTLITKNNMANAIVERGDYEMAFKQFAEIYEIITSKLGISHPSSLLVRTNMASVLEKQEKYAEALDIYREVYPKRVKSLGEARPDTDLTRSRIKALEESSIASSSKLNLIDCLKPRRKRSVTRCFFSKENVEKFIVGEIDANQPEKLKIDSQKFLKFIKSNPDVNMNTQLMELIGDNKRIKSNINDDHKFLLNRVIEDQGFDRYLKNERMNQLTGEIERENTELIKQNILRNRLEGAVGKIMLVRGIHGAVVTCFEGGSKTDCGLCVGGMTFSFIAHPIENVLVKMTPKFVTTAGQAAEIFLPGMLGRNSKLVIRLVGVQFGVTIARTTAGFAAGVFDIVVIGMQTNNLIECKKRAKTETPCSEKEIRDSIVLLSVSGISFVSGVAFTAAAWPGVGTAVGFALMVGQGAYTGISNIIEYKGKYHTTDAENWSIFWRSVFLQSMASDLGALVSRSRMELVNGQAKLAWKYLNESPSTVVAYGIGLGETDIVPEVGQDTQESR